MKYALPALPRRRLLWAALALGIVLCYSPAHPNDIQTKEKKIKVSRELARELAKEQNKAKREERKWREEIKGKPDFDWAHAYLGFALDRQGRDKEAEEEYRVFLRMSPNSYQGHNYLGNSLMKQGKYVEAEREFREELRSSPFDNYTAHFEIANALLGQGKIEEAEKECRFAFSADSTDPNVRIGVALFLMKEKKYEEAMREFRKTLQIDTLYPRTVAPGEVYFSLACCFAQWGKREEAFTNLSRACREGFSDWIWLMQINDLESIRDDPRFGKLSEKIKSQMRRTW
jgi:Tfp pilus assembly protein PilF